MYWDLSVCGIVIHRKLWKPHLLNHFQLSGKIALLNKTVLLWKKRNLMMSSVSFSFLMSIALEKKKEQKTAT